MTHALRSGHTDCPASTILRPGNLLRIDKFEMWSVAGEIHACRKLCPAGRRPATAGSFLLAIATLLASRTVPSPLRPRRSVEKWADEAGEPFRLHSDRSGKLPCVHQVSTRRLNARMFGLIIDLSVLLIMMLIRICRSDMAMPAGRLFWMSFDDEDLDGICSRRSASRSSLGGHSRNNSMLVTECLRLMFS